jgi:hypothetical protein
LGKPVENVVFHALSALLMATKPTEPVHTLLREFSLYQGRLALVYIIPRAKAICWDDGEVQRVSWALHTLFRNPTMPAIAGQRC